MCLFLAGFFSSSSFPTSSFASSLNLALTRWVLKGSGCQVDEDEGARKTTERVACIGITIIGVAKIVDKQGEGVVYPLGLTSQEQGDQPQGWAQGYCTVSDESVQEGKE
ncbi:hypothetical protein FA13DRAFT_1706667 [Coprinellus micaceus]|uniref:Uncharacterized protein n=1 Tax=Coprinellus micaceus TaxID=71717 RepID=A0A4Y7TM89_COPMI|nr:hypothetical protein FA13DRAFT_1706667 [Coprinellus micaceus]